MNDQNKDREIKILNVGCSITELIKSPFITDPECILPGLMKRDPRINLDSSILKRFSFMPDEQQDAELTQIFNEHLARAGMEPLYCITECTDHVFDFVIPDGQNIYKIKLESFFIAPIMHQETQVRQDLLSRVRNRLWERQDILGFCRFCAYNSGLPERFANIQDYDASLPVPFERTIEIVRKKYQPIREGDRSV